jgi:hypothetical protein
MNLLCIHSSEFFFQKIFPPEPIANEDSKSSRNNGSQVVARRRDPEPVRLAGRCYHHYLHHYGGICVFSVVIRT